MPLKFIEKVISGEDTVGLTGPAGTPKTPYVPKSVTEVGGNGFSLKFTDGKEYNLDEIIESIKRDNPNHPLAIQVLTGDTIELQLIQIITLQLLDEYSTDNINNVPNFAIIFQERYDEALRQLDIISADDLTEGSLLINEKQKKICITKADMRKYLLHSKGPLLDPKNHEQQKPMYNMSRPMVSWREDAGDLNQNEDFENFYTIYNILYWMENTIDGGSFSPIFIDGGDFSPEYNPQNEMDGGSF